MRSGVLQVVSQTIRRSILAAWRTPWRAANYLSVGQIYLLDTNPLLERPLVPEDIKPRCSGTGTPRRA